MTFFQLLKQELKAILSNSAITLTIFGGVVFYSFLYPLPYESQIPREQSINVVNFDHSLLSYQLERMVDATPQVHIVGRANSIEEAKQNFMKGKVGGILVIPQHFYRDLMLGKSPTLSFAGDASYFLVYGTVIEGLANVSGTVAAKAKVSKLILEGAPKALAEKQYQQVGLNMKPTFNPTNGYINYVLPAVFVLILQQTLIMGVGLLGGSQKNETGYWEGIPIIKLLSARTLVFVAIYYLLSLYYFGFNFDVYSVNALASMNHILLLLAPFLLVSVFIGIVLGAFLPRRELVTFVVLVSSMPLLFSTGFIWPLESIPSLIIFLSHLFPSTPAIQGFLAINQMGADYSMIIDLRLLLWGQALLWGVLAYFSYKRYQQK